MRKRVLAVVIALGIGASAAAAYQLNRSNSGNPLPTARAAPSDRANDSGAVSEGIGVRGAWTIVIRNPDGSVASRHEFDNALEPTGELLLLNLVMRDSSMGRWRITLLAPSGGESPCALPQHCQINQGVQALSQNNANLVLSPTDLGMQMSGSLVANRDGSIGEVDTTGLLCRANVAPGDCLGNETRSRNFTSHELDEPISVLRNQQVFVKIVISFSAVAPTAPPS